MANDSTRKTLRHFYCRDVLWQSFERMSEALDRGVDELVNEAMRALAQQQGFLPSDFSMSAGDGLAHPEQPGLPRPDARSGSGTSSPDAQAGSDVSRTGLRRSVPPPLPPVRTTAEHPTARPQPPPLPSGFSLPAQTEATAAMPLFLVFGNQRYVIDKDQFIIGRGTKSSDLPIRDGNISRKHAVVVRRNGEYFIKDLGSTNGIEYKGERIEGKKIEEGDTFSICDYQLKFTYK
jgi:FHA domain